jgi:hypothetical protein
MFRHLGLRALPLAAIAYVCVTAVALAQSGLILPGATWKDTSGNVIEAHGGGMIKVGSTYYWVGEDHTNGFDFQNINCYSSTDLSTWAFVNHVLTLQASGDLGPSRVVERPKILYNSATSTYVMWMHIDDTSYSEAKVGVATSPTVCGNYSYLGSFQPLGFQSRDMNLFEDTNGTAYLLTEDRGTPGLRIDQLSSNYQTVVSATKLISVSGMEAPAIVKVGGTYYFFCSHQSGWSPNDNEFMTATSLSGTWSSLADFAPSGTNTYSSQTTYVLPVSGTGGTTYIYMGDRWVSSNLATSTYIWLPLTISGTTASLPMWYNRWLINTTTGTWEVDCAGCGIQTGVPLQVVNDNSGICLDNTGAGTTEGTQQDQWTCNGGTNQNWTLTSEGGSDYQMMVQNSGQVLDVAGQSMASGAKVDQWDWNGGANQKWYFTSNGSGYYTIRNLNSGLCLDVSGESKTGGALIVQNTCNGGASQLWRFQ